MPALTMRDVLPIHGPRAGSPYMWRIAGNNARSSEGRVVTGVIAWLIDVGGYTGSQIKLEYNVDSCCRVDIVVFDDPLRVLLFECKGFRVGSYDVRQVVRYRDSALARWPDRQIVAAMVAPEYKRTVTQPDGVSLLVLQ